MDFVDDPKLRCETKHIWGDSPKVEISKVTIDFLFHKKKYIAVYILLIRSLMLKRKERNDNAEKCTTSENDA